MSVIDLYIACHKLHLNPIYTPVKWKRMKYAPENSEIINIKVNKLHKINFNDDIFRG